MDQNAQTAINYAPLSQPVTQADVRHFKQTVVAQQNPNALKYVRIFYIVLLIPAILLIASLVLRTATSRSPFNPASIFLPLFVVTIFCIVWWATNYQYRRSVRLYRFATANYLSYQLEIKDPPQSGMLFSVGGSRESKDVIASSKNFPAPFELGQHQFVTGSGKNRSTHVWKYICITLPRLLPHMVLDSSKNNINFGFIKASNLPVTFNKDQVLSLEGDFDKYFTLYAPKEYERDALYIFTPDLMALFIDETAEFDAEIVDDKLYLYSQKALFEQPQQMQRVFAIIEKIGMKTRARTQNYQDDKMLLAKSTADSSQMVAVQGRRLRKGVRWAVVILVTIIILVQLILQFLPFLLNIL